MKAAAAENQSQILQFYYRRIVVSGIISRYKSMGGESNGSRADLS